jgi:hypothetical protein
MAAADADPDPGTSVDARALEVTFPVPAGGEELLRDPAELGRWLCSRVWIDGARATLVVEEEYGYRRSVQGKLERTEHGFVVQVDRAQREWDGCDGTPVGPVAPAARWDEAELLGTRLECRVLDGIASARWTGFAPTALDATRREGVLLRYGVERAGEALGGHEVERPVIERRVDATPAECWAALDEGSLLRPDPGTGWSARGAAGQVLVAVAGRRLAASWRGVEDPNRAGLLDVYMGHEPDGRTSLRAELVLAHADARAAAWLEDVVDSLVEATSRRRNACESW